MNPLEISLVVLGSAILIFVVAIADMLLDKLFPKPSNQKELK